MYAEKIKELDEKIELAKKEFNHLMVETRKMAIIGLMMFYNMESPWNIMIGIIDSYTNEFRDKSKIAEDARHGIE